MSSARMQIIAALLAVVGTAAGAGAQPAIPEGFLVQPQADIRPPRSLDSDFTAFASIGSRDFLNSGWGTSTGFGFPIYTGRTERGGSVGWDFDLAYRYARFDGSDNYQLNQPGGKSFNINHADFHLCVIGLERKTSVPLRTFRFLALPRFSDGFDGDRPGPFSGLDESSLLGGSSVIIGLGVRGQLGGASAEVSQARFDPTRQQVVIQGAPRDQAFVGGYELYAKVGLQFSNGVEFNFITGYGQLFTGLLDSRSTANSYVPLGVTVEIPFRPRLGLTYDLSGPRRRLYSRAEYGIQPN